MNIIIKQWYDLVTPESASNGDYEETGLSMVDNETSDLFLAVGWYIEALNDLGFYEVNKFNGKIDWANEVIYAADPIIDYSDGFEEHHCLAVIMPKHLNNKFNALVDQLLNKQAV